MKKFLLIVILGCSIGTFLAVKYPGTFLKYAEKGVVVWKRLVYAFYPTFLDGQDIDTMISAEIDEGVSVHMIEFQNEMMHVEIHNPGGTNLPAIILLYNQDDFFQKNELARIAQEAMIQGALVIIPRYPDLPQPKWVHGIQRTLDVAAAFQNAHKSRFALAGFGVGGVLAVHVTSTDERIRALALHEGFLSEKMNRESIRAFPPTILVSKEHSKQEMNRQILADWLEESSISHQSLVNSESQLANWKESSRFLMDQLMGVEENKVNESKREALSQRADTPYEFILKSGRLVKGTISQESEESYLILTEENAHEILEKKEVHKIKK